MKYYPVGTVVRLCGGTKRVMIDGYATIDQSDPARIYDYSGVLYPEGSLSSDQTLLFNHKQIEEVFFIGYTDREQKDFMEKLEKIREEEKSFYPAGLDS